VRKYLDFIKKLNKNQAGKGNATLDQLMAEEEEKEKKWKIGPFSFDIDYEIDTEILTADEVYKDLKEVDDILVRDSDKKLSAHVLQGAKKKKRRNFN